MKRLLAALAICMCLAPLARGGEFVPDNPGLNFAIATPDGSKVQWNPAVPKPHANAAYSVVDAPCMRSITVLVMPTGGKTVSMEMVRKGVLQGSKQLLSSSNLTVHGMPALETRAVVAAGHRDARTIVRFIQTRNYIYVINCTRLDGDPWDDPDMMRVLGSFRFLKPPQPPASSKLLFAVIGIAVVVVLVGVLVFLVVKRGSGKDKAPARRTRRRPGARPAARPAVPVATPVAAPVAARVDAPSAAAPPVAAQAISITCPECGKKLKAKASVAGRQVKCPACGEPFTAEAADA